MAYRFEAVYTVEQMAAILSAERLAKCARKDDHFGAACKKEQAKRALANDVVSDLAAGQCPMQILIRQGEQITQVLTGTDSPLDD